MDKKVVVLRKINGLWCDSGIRYDTVSEKNPKPGLIPAQLAAGPVRQGAGLPGSLHLVA